MQGANMDAGYDNRLVGRDKAGTSNLCWALDKGGLSISDSALALAKKVGRNR